MGIGTGTAAADSHETDGGAIREWLRQRISRWGARIGAERWQRQWQWQGTGRAGAWGGAGPAGGSAEWLGWTGPRWRRRAGASNQPGEWQWARRQQHWRKCRSRREQRAPAAGGAHGRAHGGAGAGGGIQI